jgi:hypothetical protein
MPPQNKSSCILLKKQGSNIKTLSNNRPVSTLTYISNVIEWVVARKINDHLTLHNLFDIRESAYRNFHSCETELTYVFNCAYRAMDHREVILLVRTCAPKQAKISLCSNCRMKDKMRHSRGTGGGAVGSSIYQWSKIVSEEWYAAGLKKLELRWQKYINFKGDSFEKLDIERIASLFESFSSPPTASHYPRPTRAQNRI